MQVDLWATVSTVSENSIFTVNLVVAELVAAAVGDPSTDVSDVFRICIYPSEKKLASYIRRSSAASTALAILC